MNTICGGNAVKPAWVHASRALGLRGRLQCFLAATGLGLLAACDMVAPSGGDGRVSLDVIEDTSQYQIVPASRAFISVPMAPLVFERSLGRGAEQMITLPNATSVAGDNKILIRAQTSSTINLARFNLAEVMERFGGTPYPFQRMNNSQLETGQDALGSFVYATERLGTDTVCVLAIRRLTVGARPLPRGTDALDVVMRNCADGGVQAALEPISARSLSISGAGENFAQSPFAAPMAPGIRN